MNIEKLKKVNTLELADFIKKAISDYCSEKKEDITVDKMNSVSNELSNIALTYSAYLIKEGKCNKVYDDFIKSEVISKEVKEIIENTVKDIWHIVSLVSESFEADELIAYTLLHDICDLKKGVSVTPNTVIELSKQILEINDDDTVLDLCSGRGTFFREITNGTKGKYIGVEINYIERGISLIRMEALNRDANMYLMDVHEYNSSEKYDKVFSNFPFENKIVKTDSKIEKYASNIGISADNLRYISSDWLFNLNIIENMKDTGKGIGICIGGDLWNGRSEDKKIREYFVENGLIEAIIALPAGLFELTSIPTYLLVFSKGNEKISMIDGSHMGVKENPRTTILRDKEINTIASAIKKETDISKNISKKEIKEKEYMLDPMKYLEVIPDFTDGIALENLAVNISRGDQLRAAELKKYKTSDKTLYGCLELANMRNGYIEFQDEYLKELPEGREKYLAKNNMIIIARNGNPNFRAALIEKTEEEILVTGHFIMIEFDETKVNPEYVQSFLASDIGKKCLRNISAGSVIKNISIGQLKKMMIPVPSREVQDKIGAEYMATLDELIFLKRKTQRKEESLNHIFEEGYFE